MKSSLVFALPLVGFLAACAAGNVNSSEVVSATASASISGPSSVTLQGVAGTYSSCHDHTDGEQWELPLNGYMGTLGSPALLVEHNDPTCVLTVTYLTADGSTWLQGATPITLGATFPPTAVAFGSPVAFYANADMSPADFSADFNVNITYSAAPSVVAVDGGSHSVDAVNGSATSGAVPAPDYTVDTTTAPFTEQTDIAGLVVSSSGTATFTATSTSAQLFVITTSTLDGTFATDDAAFKAGTAAAFGGSLTSTQLIPLGVTLPYTTNVLLQNVADGVPSYQTFTLTFN
jgi:hypothetical protein